MGKPFLRSGVLVLCAGLLVVALGPRPALAQSDAGDLPRASGSDDGQRGGSEVFNDSGEDVGTRKPPRPALPPPPETEPETEPEPDRGGDPEAPAGGEQPGEVAELEEPAPPPVERVPVPDKAAQAKALKLVKDVFEQEYKKKSDEDKLALAAQLLDQASGPGNDAPSQYVMLREARDLAAAAGDVDTAFAAADGLAAAFTGVDAVALKLETLAAASKKVAHPAKAEALVDGHIALSAELLAAAELDRAAKVVAQAEPVARKAKNPEVTARLAQRKKELKELVSQYGTALGAAKAKLAKTPADPAASATLGRFYCLAAGDWERGLPMLAQGNDVALRKAAAADLAGADGPAAAMAGIGDAWWEFGEKQTGLVKARARGRAASWYQQAVAELAGLERTRLEKRLAQVSPEEVAGGSSEAPPDKAVQMLTNLVRKLPADARPRKGQGWDSSLVSRWLNRQVRAAPFDALMKVASVNVSRYRGRDTLNAYFEPIGPVEHDGVDYRMTVSLDERVGAAAADIVKKLTRGTQVRVRGVVSSMSLGGSGGNGIDIQSVDFWLYLDRPNLTIVKPPGAGGGGAPAANRKGPHMSGQRVLDTIVRRIEADTRPLRYEDWTADATNEWLDQQFAGKAIEIVTQVVGVSATRQLNEDFLSVQLDSVGPITAGGGKCYLTANLHGSDPRLKKLTAGTTVRLRATLMSIRATSSSSHNGVLNVLFSPQFEDDYTISPVAEAKPAAR